MSQVSQNSPLELFLRAVLADRAAAARPLPCLLCGRPEAVRAFFAPKDQRRAGAIVGKVRLLRYSLCKRCVRKPGAQCRVEERLFAAMGSMARRN